VNTVSPVFYTPTIIANGFLTFSRASRRYEIIFYYRFILEIIRIVIALKIHVITYVRNTFDIFGFVEHHVSNGILFILLAEQHGYCLERRGRKGT